MISEDKGAPSNLPKEVKREFYPKKSYVNSKEMDDSITGVDKTISEAVKKFNSR